MNEKMIDKMIMDDKTIVIFLHNDINKEKIKEIIEEILKEKARENMHRGYELIPGLINN